MKPSEHELQGKVAIITGGGRGIGRGIAERLAEAGAEIIIADIDISKAKKTAEELAKKGKNSLAIQVDVSKERAVNFLIKKSLEKFNKVDILINNAGIMLRTRLQNISLEEWEKIMKVNLTGPFLLIKALLPIMKKNSYGRIINISSSAGRSVSTLGGPHYTASKAGLLGLTRAAAKELAAYGITVNAVCPGLIDTQMVRKTTKKAELKAFLNSFPIQRLGLPEEIGDLVVFLCSERASYITGASIDINGGDLMI